MTSRKKQPAREKRHSLTRSLSPVYPFAAIVGQDDMKLALLLSVLDPYLGGVVIMGHRGTGKSTAVRALADLVPARTRVKGCLFNCDPDRSQDFCQDCSQKARRLPRESFRVPVVDLPLGATEDRVCGSLDIERALTQGSKAFEPGLLAKAHRGFLYIDEVNLLEDFLVDLLLDAAASGRNQVEREGISVSHPARFVLVGSGNPEEGELRPQLLDRFGLFVQVATLSSVEERVEIVERRDRFERDPQKFCEQMHNLQEDLRQQLHMALELMPQVSMDPRILHQVAELCGCLQVDGHRGELTISRSARGMAAWSGRVAVNEDDIRRVAVMSLRHRLRKDPLEVTESPVRIMQMLERIFPPTTSLDQAENC